MVLDGWLLIQKMLNFRSLLMDGGDCIGKISIFCLGNARC